MRRRTRLAIGSLGAAGAVALFVLVAPYDIAARKAHLPGVEWLLHTYLHNAVRTWAAGTKVPDWADLDDPALVRLGAAHFATGCAPCHGAPGQEPARVTRGMRPEPPRLDLAAHRLESRELWWITWNGLKYTGMPAWPGAHRDDEPWALAAFLAQLGDLDAEAYGALAYGPADVTQPALGAAPVPTEGDDPAAGCARCHGADGLGRGGTAPVLAGQAPEFLAAALRAYAQGLRPSGFMEPVAAGLSGDEIRALARHFSELPPSPGHTLAEDAREEYLAGAVLAREGSLEVPSCVHCHGDGRTRPRRAEYPSLAGEHRRFLVVWLRLWRDRPVGGTAYAQAMHEAARWLSDQEIAALATYFAAGGDAARRVGQD